MDIIALLERTTLANVTSVIVALTVLGYAVYNKDSELIAFVAGAGVTWLFDQKNSSNGTG